MKHGYKKLRILFLLVISFISYAEEIALTIDDLPFVGQINGNPWKYRREHDRFMKILEILRKYHIPATGFVIAGFIEEGQWQWLVEFKEAGNTIGNHSYSHVSLSQKSLNWYIDDVHKADKILQPLLSSPKYYRFPYLAEGTGTKYSRFREYLFSCGYVVAPVMVDSKDFRFNVKFLQIPWRLRSAHLSSYRQSYLNFIWKETVRVQSGARKKMGRPVKIILLIHMNTLNSYFLEDVIKLYQQHGYHFISLSDALKDPYYSNQNLFP